MICSCTSQVFDAVALEARIIIEPDDEHEKSGSWRDCLIHIFDSSYDRKTGCSGFLKVTSHSYHLEQGSFPIELLVVAVCYQMITTMINTKQDLS